MICQNITHRMLWNLTACLKHFAKNINNLSTDKCFLSCPRSCSCLRASVAPGFKNCSLLDLGRLLLLLCIRTYVHDISASQRALCTDCMSLILQKPGSSQKGPTSANNFSLQILSKANNNPSKQDQINVRRRPTSGWYDSFEYYSFTYISGFLQHRGCEVWSDHSKDRESAMCILTWGWRWWGGRVKTMKRIIRILVTEYVSVTMSVEISLNHPWKRLLFVSYKHYQMLNIRSTHRQVQTARVRPWILDCTLQGGVVRLLVCSKISLPQSESLFSNSVSCQTVMTAAVLDIHVEINNHSVCVICQQEMKTNNFPKMVFVIVGVWFLISYWS